MSNTIRVLSLDGGGIRGIYSARLLELFCQQAKIDPTKIYTYFDVIAGTSIGGIQALAYAKGLTPTYVGNLLIDNASSIFNCTHPIPGGGQAGYGTWSAYISGLYSSLYSQDPLANLINQNFGTDKISDYQTSVIIPAFQTVGIDTSMANVPVYFSNVSNSVVSYLSGQSELVANIALATSAAPVYFPPAIFNGNTYIDGGVFLNNAVSFALAIGKAKKPTANRFCVLSLGTGLGNMGYIPDVPSSNTKDFKGAIDNIKTIKKVMDISMSIPPEGVSAELDILSKYTLSNIFYLRLQNQISKTLYPDSTLDNSSSEFIIYLQHLADTTFDERTEDINTFIARMSL